MLFLFSIIPFNLDEALFYVWNTPDVAAVFAVDDDAAAARNVAHNVVTEFGCAAACKAEQKIRGVADADARRHCFVCKRCLTVFLCLV